MSKLRTYRKDRNLSQADLARAVGVQKATISRIEKGSRVPSMSLVARLVEVTNLAADDFLPAAPSASEPA